MWLWRHGGPFTGRLLVRWPCCSALGTCLAGQWPCGKSPHSVRSFSLDGSVEVGVPAEGKCPVDTHATCGFSLGPREPCTPSCLRVSDDTPPAMARNPSTARARGRSTSFPQHRSAPADRRPGAAATLAPHSTPEKQSPYLSQTHGRRRRSQESKVGQNAAEEISLELK